MRDEMMMMRMRMMRITRKRRTRTMDDKNNDDDNTDDDNNTTIKRKRGRRTRMWDEDKGRGMRTREEDCGVIALYHNNTYNIVTHIP